MTDRYELVSPEEQGFLPSQQKKPRDSADHHLRRWKYATFSLIVVCVGQLMLMPWGSRACSHNQYKTGFETDFDDAKVHIQLEERRFKSPIRASENGTLYRVEAEEDSEGVPVHYTGDHPAEELDAAWHDLVGSRYFLFNEAEVQTLNQDPFPLATEPLDKMDGDVVTLESGVYGGVDMLHSLHCLDVLRRQVIGGRHSGHQHGGLPSDIERMHIDHCIDQLRQTIMCSGDLTPVTLRPVKQTREDMPLWILLGETERRHTCRSFEDIHQWVRDRGKRGVIQGI